MKFGSFHQASFTNVNEVLGVRDVEGRSAPRPVFKRGQRGPGKMRGFHFTVI